jgi:hypothetical protein
VRVDVDVARRIHQRPRSSFDRGIVSLSREILCHLLHVCRPVDFSICKGHPFSYEAKGSGRKRSCLQGTFRTTTAESRASARSNGGMIHNGNLDRELKAKVQADRMKSIAAVTAIAEVLERSGDVALLRNNPIPV